MEIKRTCNTCGKELIKTKMRIGSNSILLYKISDGLKGLFSNYSKVDAYVCSGCGHVELVAENVEVFK